MSAMLNLIAESRFKKDLKREIKSGLNKELLNDIITKLRNKIPLEAKFKDHYLSGNYSGFKERVPYKT